MPLKPIPIRRFIPNILTVLAICAGMTSMRYTMDGSYVNATWFIIAAMILDGADGRLARFLNSSSKFGAELDTLADFFNFGVVPGLLVYKSLFHGTGHANAGWLAVLTLCICCAMRLARFNVGIADVASDDPEAAAQKRKFFQGVPAPVVASLALTPVFFLNLGIKIQGFMLIITAVCLLFVAYLAVSTIATFSIKHLKIPSEMGWQLLVALVFGTLLAVVYPWQTLIVLNLAYVGSLYFSYKSSAKS